MTDERLIKLERIIHNYDDYVNRWLMGEDARFAFDDWDEFDNIRNEALQIIKELKGENK